MPFFTYGPYPMSMGFGADPQAFAHIVGWELYQVTLDKFHVMFWFENGHALLNVASKFSYVSADRMLKFTYNIYGPQKRLELDRLLRASVSGVGLQGTDQLKIVFSNGDVLTVHDDPEFRSWWFIEWDQDSVIPPSRVAVWSIEDADPF